MKPIGRPKVALIISVEERDELVRLTQRGRVNRNLAFRAKLVLACGDGITSTKHRGRSPVSNIQPDCLQVA